MTKSQIIKHCLNKIEEKSCLGNSAEWVQRDFEKLSDLIEKETDISLSVSTLRRVWNAGDQFRPQKSTLDALALFVGYKDWHEYMSRFGGTFQTSHKVDGKIRVAGFFALHKTKLLLFLVALLIGFVSAFLLFDSFNKTDLVVISTTTSASIIGPEIVIDSLYHCLTFDRNEKPDVKAIRKLFLKDASILLKTREDVMVRYSVEGFVNSLDDFSQDEYIRRFGYKARAEKSWVYEYGDIAHVYAHYKGVLFGFDQAFNMGFDSFHLVKTNEGWKISSLIGDYFNEDIKLPEFLN